MEPSSATEAAKVAGDTTKPQPDRVAERATEKASPSPAPETADTSKVAKSSTEAKSKDAAVPTVPSGSSGLAEKSDGLFLRYNTDNREWDRLNAGDPLEPLRSPALPDSVPRVDHDGKDANHHGGGDGSPHPLRLDRRGARAGTRAGPALDPPAGLQYSQGRLLEPVRQPRYATREHGRPREDRAADLRAAGPANRSRWRFAASREKSTFTIDSKQEELKASNVAVIDAGQVRIATPDSLPPWATQPEPSPYELQVRDQFLKMFHPGRPILAELVAAIEDERKEIKDLAIRAMKALGDLSLLMPMLTRDDDPIARRRTIKAIRSYMARPRGRQPRAHRARRGIRRRDLGAIAQHMLVGYSPEEVAKGDIYPRLVGLLSPDQGSVGIRELALDSLRRLTGRDDLGYDPDHPTRQGARRLERTPAPQ